MPLRVNRLTLKSPLTRFILGVLGCTAVVACGIGGGGGGNDDQELSPAAATVSADPSTIDSGDRMRVGIQLSEIDRDGVLLKVQFPTALRFVAGSSHLRIDGDDVAVVPAFVLTTGNKGSEKSYVVYDFSKDTFGDEHSAEVSLVLEGQGEVVKGSVVAVDPDFNDSSTPANQKFSALAPQFDASASVEVRVRDTSGLITPTATATPTITPTSLPTNTPKPTKAPATK